MWDFDEDDISKPSTPKGDSKDGGVHHLNLKNKKEATKRLRSSMRKSYINISISPDSKKYKGKIFLSDVGKKGTIFFTDKPIAKGKLFYIEFTKPLALTLKVRCLTTGQPKEEWGVQKKNKAKDFKIAVEFMFDSKEQKLALKDFCNKVRDENYVPTDWNHYKRKLAEKRSREKMRKKSADVKKESPKKSEGLFSKMIGSPSKKKKDAA